MNKLIRVSCMVIALFIACAIPGQAANSHGGGRGGRGGSVSAVGHFQGSGRGLGGGVAGHFQRGSRGSGAGAVGHFQRGGRGFRSGVVGHIHRGGRWWGPGWGLGLWDLTYPYYYYPYYGYPYYDYYDQAPVVVQQPQEEIYVQPSQQPVETSYWYYCPNPPGYYPYVKRCPTGWMKVVPSPPPP